MGKVNLRMTKKEGTGKSENPSVHIVYHANGFSGKEQKPETYDGGVYEDLKYLQQYMTVSDIAYNLAPAISELRKAVAKQVGDEVKTSFVPLEELELE